MGNPFLFLRDVLERVPAGPINIEVFLRSFEAFRFLNNAIMGKKYGSEKHRLFFAANNPANGLQNPAQN